MWAWFFCQLVLILPKSGEVMFISDWHSSIYDGLRAISCSLSFLDYLTVRISRQYMVYHNSSRT